MSNHSLTVLINRRTSLCLNKTYLEAVHVAVRQNENKKKSSLRNSSTRNSFEKTSYSSDISWKLVQNTEQKYSVESVPWISGVFVFCVEPGPWVNGVNPISPNNRELKQQRFWVTHVNRKWPFFIFWRWFRPNFQSNRLYNSKEAKEYKFYIIKAC